MQTDIHIVYKGNLEHHAGIQTHIHIVYKGARLYSI
jgi:hypothetical protein